MTGMGINGPSVRYYEALSASTTIFQAEMYAINVCTRICLSTEGLAGKHVYIMSDSQAALRALKSYSFTPKLVADCLDNLKRLTTKCKLTLLWVPGHTGLEGNEEEDQLANKGSETNFIGPEPFFGYSSMKYKSDLNEWIEQRKKDHFSDLPSVLCECPAVARIKLERFGKGFMSPQTVRNLRPKSILGFLKAVQLKEI
jgi:ribonuclease HI